MSTSKLIWFRTPLMLASLVITLGLVDTAQGGAQDNPAGKPRSALQNRDLVESESEAIESRSAIGLQSSVGNCFAVIRSDGVRLRTNCVISARRIFNPGQYEIIYNGSVSTCTFLCSLGNVGTGVPSAGQCVTATRSGNQNGVFVETQNSAGNPANRDFHTAVFCR